MFITIQQTKSEQLSTIVTPFDTKDDAEQHLICEMIERIVEWVLSCEISNNAEVCKLIRQTRERQLDTINFEELCDSEDEDKYDDYDARLEYIEGCELDVDIFTELLQKNYNTYHKLRKLFYELHKLSEEGLDWQETIHWSIKSLVVGKPIVIQ